MGNLPYLPILPRHHSFGRTIYCPSPPCFPFARFFIAQANAIGGRNEKAVNEFLEKNWSADLSEEAATRLTVKALLEVVDSGSKNMEVAVTKCGESVRILSEEQLQDIINDIEREQEEAKRGTTDGSSSSTAMET